MKWYQLNSSTLFIKYMSKEDIQMISQMLFPKIRIKYWVFILRSMIVILSRILIRFKCSLRLLELINSLANPISFRFTQVWMQKLLIDKMKVILSSPKTDSIMILIRYSNAQIYSRIRSRKIQWMHPKHYY